MKPKLLLVGYGRAGKDCGLEYLSALTGMKNAGCTSVYLTKYVAAELGISELGAYQSRHRPGNRAKWFDIGNKLRLNDPGILLREALSNGPLTGGVRDLDEIVAARRFNLVDLIIWIENTRVPVDQTVKFGPEHCDMTIQNNGTIDEYHQKLKRLAEFAGLV